MSKFNNLVSHIVDLSESNNYQTAKNEWELLNVEFSEDFEKCPCGQSIKEICHIKNIENNNTTFVGNKCIKQFMGVDVQPVFSCLKRMRTGQTINMNKITVEWCCKMGFLYEKERNFLLQTMKKRNLSIKQASWKEKINHRVLNKVGLHFMYKFKS